MGDHILVFYGSYRFDRQGNRLAKYPHTGIGGDADIPRTFAFDASKPVERVIIRPVATGKD